MKRAVLVTGGSRGIGRAVCAAFAARGDRVAVHSTRGTMVDLPGTGTWPSPVTSQTRLPSSASSRRQPNGSAGSTSSWTTQVSTSD